MKALIYQIDAFTTQQFSGNPASVCILPSWLSEADLFAIAKENNQPVTAFLVREQEKFSIRWITPEYELDLCGHGTLAAAFVIFNFLEPTWQMVDIQSRHELLNITRTEDLITLNFPAKKTELCHFLPLLAQGLGLTPTEIYQDNNERCFAVYDSEEQVKKLIPDMTVLKNLPHRGIIATAKGNTVDFVSRTFYPQKNISEDPVTGSSHCLLIPYWAMKLNKTILHAKQISSRGGELFCQLQNNRVLISGKATLYLQGNIHFLNL